MNLTSLFRPRSRGLVGVDIGSSSVKIVSLKPARTGFALDMLAMEPVPHDSIVDGAIISKVPVSEAIERVFKSERVRNARVATAISGHSVIVKKIAVPAQTPEELEQSIQWEAEQYIPFDISDVNLDYQIVGQAADGSRIEVILVAAKRDKIADYTSVISMAGTIPTVVDIDAFALQNAYELNYTPNPTVSAVLLHVGCATMNISMVRGSEFLFTRDIAMGGNQYTDVIQKEMHVSFDQAERYKQGEVPEGLGLRVRQILDSVSEILALEVQKTLDYFKTTAQSEEIREIYLSGGASRTQGLREHLQNKFQVPVEFLNPFKRLHTGNEKFSPDWLEQHAVDFAIAVGLAIRTARDR